MRQCREWIASHSQPPPRHSALTKILSPHTLCLDGDIYSDTAKEAIAWADGLAADRTGRPRLVVRSPGGDAKIAIGLAEKLQRLDAEVTVVDYCMSSCANYFFAALRRRSVEPGAAILFHGGFSAEDRAETAEMLDQALRDPQMAAHIPDPVKWRAQQLNDFDEEVARQDALFRRAGVDPLLATGMKGVDEKAIPAARCGGTEGTKRAMLFFDSKQLRRLGIAVRHGKPLTDPALMGGLLTRFGFRFTACAVPASYFSAR
ncbi:MAG: hypothetical protein ACJ8ER_04025 [Allosphingosinicella sp.]